MNEIPRSGYMKQFLAAEKSREASVKKAARLLEPFGIKESDITLLIENSLKKNAEL